MNDLSATDPNRAAPWTRAVDLLTQAIRLTSVRTDDGTVTPDDFSDFLASALTAAAANVGGIECVTAGRADPGSWDAFHIQSLLRSRIGHEDEALVLIAHRTEQVLIPLNVAQLVEDSGCLPTIDEAIPTAIGEDGRKIMWLTTTGTEALLNQYRSAYETYATTFAAAVDEVERELRLEGLRAEVQFVAMSHPDAANNELRNPDEWDSDPLVWRIWSTARERSGTPQLQPPPSEPAPSPGSCAHCSDQGSYVEHRRFETGGGGTNVRVRCHCPAGDAERRAEDEWARPRAGHSVQSTSSTTDLSTSPG